MNGLNLAIVLMDLPLSSKDYENLYYGIAFLCIFTLLFIIIYLMVGEEREETES
ncbi:MAG: hypothetical protein ACTSRS_07850 [Candidatus Helarchaeota archaeon]